VRVASIGPGELDVGDAGTGLLGIDANESAVTIRNVTCEEAILSLHGGSCHATKIDVSALGAKLSGHTSMNVDCATVGGSDGCMSCDVSLEDSTLRLVDATFKSVQGAGKGDDLDASVVGSSSLSVERSQFDGSSLAIVHDGKADWGLDVVDCKFTSPAILSIDEAFYWTGWGNLKVPGNVTGRIKNNTFDGPASGLVLMALHARLAVDGNGLRDGARMFAHYRPDFSYVLGDEIRYEYEFVDDGQGITRSILGGEVTGGNRDVFVDLRGNITGLVTPKSVTIMVISPGNIEPWADAGAMWFTRVDPTERKLDFTVPNWGQVAVRIWYLRNP
jgi:hypothetical protein